jgi:uncharacterized coiled-coil DUF342 family protein
MDQSKPSLMLRQISRVNRRLFLQIFVNRLFVCWTIALALGAVWFLLQPFLVENTAPWLRWVVAGGLVTGATFVTGLLAALAAPSKVLAALELDQAFGLKERVTTSMMLTEEQKATPAGQALLDDVQKRVNALDIAGKFPIQLSWVAALVPCSAMILALVALFYEPSTTVAKVDPRDELKQAPLNRNEINDKFNQLKKRPRAQRLNEPPDSEKFKELEMKLEEIANRPRDTRDQLRQRMAEMQKVEDDIKERQQQLLDRTRSMKNQLQQLDQQAQKSKDGPANDLEKALSKGDLGKAQEELDKLTEKMRNNELSKEDKDKLKKQLDDMQNKLQRLAQNKDKEEELQKLAREGKIDKETLDRELDRLKRDSEKLQDLADLAEQLGQCKDCLEKGNSEGAGEKLKGAADKLKEMKLNDKELDDLQDQLQRVQDAKRAANKGDKSGDKDGNGPGKDGKDGEGKDGKDGRGGKGDGKGDTEGDNEGGIGQGRRPLGKEGKYTQFEAKQKLDPDWKGKKVFDGFAPGQNFKSKPGPEIAGEVKQAAQEAPEAIEQQRIPKAARDLAKGYFKNLGGQDDKPPAKADK